MPDSPPDFEALVRDYYQPLFRFAFSLAKNESDAAELTQETFLIWAEKGSKPKEPGAPEARGTSTDEQANNQQLVFAYLMRGVHW